jgi:hypothetical protein
MPISGDICGFESMSNPNDSAHPCGIFTNKLSFVIESRRSKLSTALVSREMNWEKPKYQYLDVSDVALTATVGFVPSTKLTCGSSQRASQAIRVVKSVFRRLQNRIVRHTERGIVIICPGAAEKDLLRLCSIAEERLVRLREEPLTPTMVEEILSISSAERRRWSKDGRIPTAGNVLFSQGKKQVSLFVYSPEAISKLSARPGQIAGWRQRDKLALSLGSDFDGEIR